MRAKRIAEVVTTVLTMCALSAVGQAHEADDFPAHPDRCAVGSRAEAPTIVEAIPKGNNAVTVTITPEGDRSALMCVVMLTADLTVGLEDALWSSRTTAGADASPGRALAAVERAPSSGDLTVTLNLAGPARFERFHIAVTAYRCSWEAHGDDGLPMRAPWRLWTDEHGHPRSICLAQPSSEAIYARGFRLSNGHGILYVRAGAGKVNDLVLAGEHDAADPDNIGGKTPAFPEITYARITAGNSPQSFRASSVADAITASPGKDAHTLLITEGSVTHLFRYIDDISKPIELVLTENVQVRKTTVAFPDYAPWRILMDALASYLLAGDVDDPITQAEARTVADLGSTKLVLCQAAVVQMSTGDAYSHVYADAPEGVTGSYVGIYAAITGNWADVGGDLASIHAILVQRNGGDLDVPVRTSGPVIETDLETADKTKVVFYDGYARVRLGVAATAGMTDQELMSSGLFLRLTENMRLYLQGENALPGDPGFGLIADGTTGPLEVVRVTPELLSRISQGALWTLPIPVYDEEDELIKEIGLEALPVALLPGALRHESAGIAATALVGMVEATAEDEPTEGKEVVKLAVTEASFLNKYFKITVGTDSRKQSYKGGAIGDLVTLPGLVWRIEYTGKSWGYKYAFAGPKKDLIDVKRWEGKVLEFSASDVIGPDECKLLIIVHNPEGVNQSYFEKPIRSCRIGLQGLDNSGVADSYFLLGKRATARVHLAVPDDILTSSTVLVRISPDMKLYNTSVQPASLLPDDGMKLAPRYKGQEKNGGGQTWLAFDMAQPEAKTQFETYIGSGELSAAIESELGNIELILRPKGAKQDYLVETARFTKAGMKIESDILTLHEPKNTFTLNEIADGAGATPYYWVLGGVRLKASLTLPPEDAAKVASYAWEVGPNGKLYSDAKWTDAMQPMAQKAGAGEEYSRTWVATDFAKDLDVLLSVTITRKDGSEETFTTRLRTRILKKGDAGDDVKLVRAVLRMFGHAHNGAVGPWGTADVLPNFDKGAETLVKRFRYRDARQLKPRSKYDEPVVDDLFYQQYRRHYEDFAKAMAAYYGYPRMVSTFHRDDADNFSAWADRAAEDFRNTTITDQTLASLNATLWPSGGGSLERRDLITVWGVQETDRLGHWGLPRRKINRPYRVTVSQDGQGSIGFSQILSENKWRTSWSEQEVADGPFADLNFYRPDDNIACFARFHTQEAHEGPFYRAFVIPNQPKGYRKSKNIDATAIPRLEDYAGSTYQEGMFEQFTKGIAGYNAGPVIGGSYTNVLPYILMETDPEPVYVLVSGSKDTYTRFSAWRWYSGYRYSFEVQKKLGVDLAAPYATWKWRDQGKIKCKGTDGADKEVDMEVTFTYSAAEWGTPYTVKDDEGKTVFVKVKGEEEPKPYLRRLSYKEKKASAIALKQQEFVDSETGECLPCP